MPHILPFSLFEAQNTPSGETLTKKQTDFLDRYTKGTWSINSKTGLVDVEGSFDCSGKKLKDLMGVRFGVVTKDFYCINNLLTSLEGAPQKVDGGFYCYNNPLTSLEGAPQEVGAGFDCSGNQLTSLEGAPKKVGAGFDCSGNQLTSLEGAPKKVGAGFHCFNNQLTSLEGSPQKVDGGFYCYNNPLTSLEGAPKKIGLYFYCDAFHLDKWNVESQIRILSGEGDIEDETRAKSLVLTLLTPEQLDAYFKEHPLDLDLLDELPEIKKGVLQRTGLQDFSLATGLMRKGFI